MGRKVQLMDRRMQDLLRTSSILLTMFVIAPNSRADGNPDVILEWYILELEEAARREAPLLPDDYPQLTFQIAVKTSQDLAERGYYQSAANHLTQLLNEDMASDWREMLTARVKILTKWADTGSIELPDYRRFFLEIGPRWFEGRTQPIVTLWKIEGVDKLEKYELLRQFFQRSRNRLGEKLVLEAIVKNSTGDKAASALYGIGNLHLGAKDDDGAERTWLRVQREFPNTVAWGDAVLSLARLSKTKGDYDRAIEYFSSLLVNSTVDRAGGRFSVPYWNAQPAAQWETGDCLFAQKKYREAIEAYRLTETKYPFRSGCGNAHAAYKHSYSFYPGLCHDWLGEYKAAARLYFKATIGSSGLYSNPAADLRIVDMYEAAGQRNDLLRLIQAYEAKYLSSVRQRLSGSRTYTDQQIIDMCPTRTIRRIVEIRQMGEEKDFDGLAALLGNKGTVAGPEKSYARRGNWEAVEAARVLAQDPEKNATLLIERLADPELQDKAWLYYALGRCGTSESVEYLRRVTDEKPYSPLPKSVVYSLSLAGEKGEHTLNELAVKADRGVKAAIEQLRNGTMGDEGDDIIFPPLDGVVDLPSTLDELDLEVP